MTQQADAPMTRRALRAAMASTPATRARVVPPEVIPSPHAATPVTRRALREAERARLAMVPTQAAAPATKTPAAHTAAATPGPLTRRELRLAAQHPARAPKNAGSPQVCRPPFAASLVLPAQQVRAAQARAVISRLGAKPLAVVALSVSMLVGGVTQVHAEQSTVAADRAAAAEAERVERVNRVTAARYAAQAAAYAADKRTEALAVAEQAVGAAHEVREKASQVVDAETLAALEKATADLTDLLATAPAVEALSTVVEAQAAQDETVVADGTVEATAATPGTSPTVVPSDVTTAADDADLPPDATATSGVSPAAQLLRGEQASRAEGVEPDGRVPVAERTGDTAAGAQADAEADTVADPEVDKAAAEVLGTTDGTAIEKQLAALDIDTSAKILAAANQVAALSAEVAATADTIIAELEAQKAAEEAARKAAEEAARKAAEEVARKIAVVKDSPNGQISTDVLCGVAFQSEVLLRCDAAAALERLNEAYKADFGRDLRVVSSYRSYSAQVTTKRTRGYLAATPGTSNHGNGIAVDFGDFGGVGNFGTANHRWMRANGPAFGWHHPAIMRPGGGGPQEPWHFEFEG